MIRTITALTRASIALAVCMIAASICSGLARADATDDYPIPMRIWQTSCDAEQVLAAVRDTSPV